MSRPVTRLEQRAEAWVAPHFNARHLLRTRHWLLALDPGADEALRIAALTHDMERNLPGRLSQPPERPAEDRAYREAHQARSAEVVASWLRDQGGSEALQRAVSELVRVHEWGGSARADLLQAADSISFLETWDDLMGAWLRDGVPHQRIRDQLCWMYERIQVSRARPIAHPFLVRGLEGIDAAARAGGP